MKRKTETEKLVAAAHKAGWIAGTRATLRSLYENADDNALINWVGQVMLGRPRSLDVIAARQVALEKACAKFPKSAAFYTTPPPDGV